MPTRVFLLRHGESADPTVFHGAESDIDLSDKGRRQAEALVQILTPRRPEVVVSSAMRRARATAEPLARALGVELQIEPDLHERRVGVLSGVSVRESDIWPETVRRWTRGETSYAHEGAESFDDLRNRLLPAWQRIVDQHAGRTTVIVAHGIVCRVLLLSLLPGLGPSQWDRIGSTLNLGTSELVPDGAAWKAVVFNRQPEEIRQLGLQ